jgi:hypothetical protein
MLLGTGNYSFQAGQEVQEALADQVVLFLQCLHSVPEVLEVPVHLADLAVQAVPEGLGGKVFHIHLDLLDCL